MDFRSQCSSWKLSPKVFRHRLVELPLRLIQGPTEPSRDLRRSAQSLLNATSEDSPQVVSRNQAFYASYCRFASTKSSSSQDNVYNSQPNSNLVNTTALTMMIQKLTESQRAAIAKRLKDSPEDVAAGVLEAAVLYNTSVDRIYQCTSAAKLKAGQVTLKLPPLLLVNGRRKLWRLGDLLAAIRESAPASSASANTNHPARVATDESSAKKKGKTMGRPRGS